MQTIRHRHSQANHRCARFRVVPAYYKPSPRFVIPLSPTCQVLFSSNCIFIHHHHHKVVLGPSIPGFVSFRALSLGILVLSSTFQLAPLNATEDNSSPKSQYDAHSFEKTIPKNHSENANLTLYHHHLYHHHPVFPPHTHFSHTHCTLLDSVENLHGEDSTCIVSRTFAAANVLDLERRRSTLRLFVIRVVDGHPTSH
jgi:hypothetical protein